MQSPSLSPGRLRAGRDKNRNDTRVFDISRGCNQFVCRNNIARYGRRIGVLAKGMGGWIENNTFEKLAGGDLIHENLLILNNLISGHSMLAIDIGDARSVSIRENRIRSSIGRSSDEAIELENSRDVTRDNNILE